AAPGVGLAAPQVGESSRIIVLDVDHENPGKHLLKLINPEIVSAEGSVVWEEGCLSVLDYTADVKRAAKILLRAYTPEEKEIELAGVVTRPDRARGRGHKFQPSEVAVVAERRGLRTLKPEKIRTPEFLAQLQAFDPDVLAVAAYGRILPNSVLDAARMMPVNV